MSCYTFKSTELGPNLHLSKFGWKPRLVIVLLVFRKKDLYLIITQKLTFLISWNPADFVRISWNPADFRWNLADFVWISWNPADFVWISGEIRQISYGFQVKSGGFLTDFMKSGGVISKGQSPGMVSPMFWFVYHLYHSTGIVMWQTLFTNLCLTCQVALRFYISSN